MEEESKEEEGEKERDGGSKESKGEPERERGGKQEREWDQDRATERGRQRKRKRRITTNYATERSVVQRKGERFERIIIIMKIHPTREGERERDGNEGTGIYKYVRAPARHLTSSKLAFHKCHL